MTNKRPPVNEPLVMLWWDDSSGHDHAWQSVDDAREPPVTLCATIGWIVREDGHSLTVVQSVAFTTDFNMNSVGNPLTIPQSAVVGRQRVNVPSARKTRSRRKR